MTLLTIVLISHQHMWYFPRASPVVFCVVASRCYGRATQHNAAAHHQPTTQQLIAQMMDDMHLYYDQKFGQLQAQSNKRYLALEAKVELKEEMRRKRRGVRQMEVSKVAFYAQLTHDQTGIGNYQPIVFDLVTTNHGNGYKNSDGIFTATLPGTYVFSWTAAVRDNTYMQTQLVVNNQVKGLTWSDSGDHADFSISSNTVVVDLTQGDAVWIRSNARHTRTIAGDKLSTFSGWLLFN